MTLLIACLQLQLLGITSGWAYAGVGFLWLCHLAYRA